MTSERFGYEPEEEESEDEEELPEIEPSRGISSEEALLQAISDAGEDSPLGKMAADVLASREERTERAATEATHLSVADQLDPERVMQLLDQFEAARFDPDYDPAEVGVLNQRVDAVKDALRAQQRQDNEIQSERFLREMAALGLSEDKSQEQVAEELADIREQMEATAEYEAGTDVLNDHPLMRAYEQSRWEQRRAREVALEMAQPTDEQVLSEAAAYVDSVIEDTLAVGNA